MKNNLLTISIKYILISFFIILLLLGYTFSSCTAKFSKAETNTYFAKITSDNIYFYSQPSLTDSSKLFILPKTYFVKILNKENEQFYYAQYQDLFGYVKIEEVAVMNGIPSNPYASFDFRVFLPEGLGLYSLPSVTIENKILDIPYLYDNIAYYGEIIGEQAIPDKSNTWYYCKYQQDGSYYGYVYSVFCDKVETIKDNDQIFDIIDNPIFQKDNSTASGLSDVAMAFIIIGVSIPCLIVFYLLIKPSWMKDKVLGEKPKIVKKRHGDYFEFDDNELN